MKEIRATKDVGKQASAFGAIVDERASNPLTIGEQQRQGLMTTKASRATKIDLKTNYFYQD